MRGKVFLGTIQKKVKRITPAYAGKRRFYLANGSPLLGSPPPMRGKVRTALCPLDAVGITPAYAGKSVWLTVRLLS